MFERTGRMQGYHVAIILGGMLALIGFLASWDGLGAIKFAYIDLPRWDETAGEILESRLETHAASSSHGSHTHRYDQHYAVVRYAYQVKSQEFTSDRIHPLASSGSTDQEKIQAIVDRYPEGTQVTVHFDPVDPSQSFLERGDLEQAALLSAVGLLFALIGLGVAIVGIVLWRRAGSAVGRT